MKNSGIPQNQWWDSTQVASTFAVTAKVVRRELRSLSDDERSAYIGSLHVLYTTSDAEGRARYGDGFVSANYLIRMHLKGAAATDCDHWHDDAGIVNHHVGITWLLEASLRTVDASTAAHYWDYTLDAYELGSDWDRSFVFGEAWFGSASPPGDDHAVADSKFAFTKVLADAGAYSNVTNAYGLLRSPWNANPVPFLMRSETTYGLRGDGYASFPSCSDFASILRTSSLAEMLRALNGQLHGPVRVRAESRPCFEIRFDASVPERIFEKLSLSPGVGELRGA